MLSLLTCEVLRQRERELQDILPQDLALRVHRAISWLDRAERQTDDEDAAFIFYWVAFNAAYARDKVEWTSVRERQTFSEFFCKVVELDEGNQIYDAVWEHFSASIRTLADNKYVFQPFWNFRNQMPGYEDWEEAFQSSKNVMNSALAKGNTTTVLDILFDRLYVLRNQLIHGAATWHGTVNRSQVKDGARILAFLVPIFIDIMMQNHDTDWGVPSYPVQQRLKS